MIGIFIEKIARERRVAYCGPDQATQNVDAVDVSQVDKHSRLRKKLVFSRVQCTNCQ